MSESTFESLGVSARGEDLLPLHFQTCAEDEEHLASSRAGRSEACGMVPDLILKDSDEDRLLAGMVAEDYARHGQLRTAAKILLAAHCDQIDEDEAVEQAIGQMTAKEKCSYERGKQLFEGSLNAASLSSLTAADAQAVEDYVEIKTAFESVGNFFEEESWSRMVLAGQEENFPLACAGPAELDLPELPQQEPAHQPEKWQAGRRLNARLIDDGTAVHTITGGDNLWSIASDILKEQHTAEYRPSNREILHMVRELSSLNSDTSKTMLPGQELVIPKEYVLKAKSARGEALLVRNKEAEIADIYHPGGARTEIGRYPDGSIATVKDANGQLWIGGDGGKWRIQSLDAEGRPASREIDGSVEVFEDGTITLTNETEQTRSTQYPDGLVLEEIISEMEFRQR